MPSAAERPPDPGMARERTALAWQRVGTAFTTFGALVLGAAAHRNAPWMLAPAAATLTAAALVWRYARRRAAQTAPPGDPRALRWLAVAGAAGGALAGVLAGARGRRCSRSRARADRYCRSGPVRRDGRRHAVLHAMGARDPRRRHHQREGHVARARRLAVAGQCAHGAQGAGLRMAAALRRRGAHPPADGAAAPGHGERCLERRTGLLALHRVEEAHDLPRRREVRARQARAVDDPRMDPERRDLPADDGGAGRRRPARAELRSQVLEQHLGIEVVGR